MGPNEPSEPAPASDFATTQWTVVLAAKDAGSGGAAGAFADVCRVYWMPLYAYLRRRGYQPAEAEDLTQGFFGNLIEKHGIAGVERGRGRFRAYLLGAMKHFLANERDKANAHKRGGGQALLSLDIESAEGRIRQEPADESTPERLFERQWALALLDRVLSLLAFAYEKEARLFNTLKEFLVGGNCSYADAAGTLDMSEGAVRVAVHRMRKHYRKLLRAEIGRTVESEAEIDAEIADLFEALGR